MNDMSRERLAYEALDQLKHDLGKYMRMPVAFLSPDASKEDLKQALEMALLQTRSSAQGYQKASEIWGNFLKDWGASFDEHQTFQRLVSTVENALSWEAALEDDSRLNQTEITRDLSQVNQVISTLMDELSNV